MTMQLIDTLPAPHKCKKGWPWTEARKPVSEKMSGALDWPRISIVTPSFNQGQYLEETIKSVLSQGYPNLEYIIIDGGSNDNSLEIIKKYQEYLHYWCSEQDGGHYAAVNKGFKHATGEIFAWINSDDLYCPWSFRTVAQVFTQFSNMQWLSSLSPLIWDSQSYCRSVHRLAGFSKEAFLDGCYYPKWRNKIGWIQQESTFWRKELWEKVGGLRPKFKLAADFDLWARFYIHTDVYGIDSPIGGFRLHGDQRSLDNATIYSDEAEVALLELRESFGDFENKQPLARIILSKIPIVHVYSERYYKNIVKEYIGKRLVHAGIEKPGEWKLVENHFTSKKYI